MVKVSAPRVRPLFEGVDWWTVPEKRAHVVEQIRAHDIKDWHGYWGARTPMRGVRKELIAEAYARSVAHR